MSFISKISIKNYRGIRELNQDFKSERFVILIGRGDSGKSTILSAINSVLSPSWNMAFSDLDFYEQDTKQPIEIEVEMRELPIELLKESKFGMYVQNELENDVKNEDLALIIRLFVDETLEPHWVVKARSESDLDNKPISGTDRSLLAVNCISDYTDNQFAYNRQSPIYALTKAALEDGRVIEHLKSQLIRSIIESTDHKILAPLNAPLGELMITANQLGLNVKDLSAQIDIKENPYTGNSISLHEESMPYRLHGKGSKRLMSMAVQLEMTKQGGIVLIDELEQGLEPDRIVSLVRKLKQTSSGQVFITTHSLNVILEASSQNLFVLNKGCRTLSVVDESFDQCRRTNPQAFFAKKIICCEGKTEQGFIRSLDTWLLKERNTSLSAKGVVIVNAGGGDKMYTYAVKLKSLGYNTCVFADDDKPQELASSKNSATEAEVSLFLCEEGNCIEQQLFMDLPWEYVIEMVNCDEDGFPNKHIQTAKDGLKAKINDADNDEDQYNIRRELAKLSTTKGREWFKHIPGGEFLGLIFTEAYDKIDAEKGIKSTINKLLTWCDIPDERLERLY